MHYVPRYSNGTYYILYLVNGNILLCTVRCFHLVDRSNASFVVIRLRCNISDPTAVDMMIISRVLRWRSLQLCMLVSKIWAYVFDRGRRASDHLALGGYPRDRVRRRFYFSADIILLLFTNYIYIHTKTIT